MNVQAKPSVGGAQRLLPFERIALVLQGGGALGAYQAGVYEALAESRIEPDWIAGISIGGINAAIIAGNPPNMRVHRLREFWTQVTSDAVWNWFGWRGPKGDGARKLLNHFNANLALMQGPGASSRPSRSRHGCSRRGRSPASTTLTNSIGVSLASNVLAHREQFHQSSLASHAIPSGIPYQETMQQLMHYFAVQGSSIGQAQQQAIAWIGQQVQAQASLLAFIDVFWTLMLVSAAAVPLALLLRKVKLGGATHLGH